MPLIEFVGPAEYQTFLDMKSSGAAPKTVFENTDKKVLRGDWQGGSVFVLWDTITQSGKMVKVNTIEEAKALQCRIKIGDLSSFEKK